MLFLSLRYALPFAGCASLGGGCDDWQRALDEQRCGADARLEAVRLRRVGSHSLGPVEMPRPTSIEVSVCLILEMPRCGRRASDRLGGHETRSPVARTNEVRE